MKTIHITEEQEEKVIEEMAYPASFNFEEFRELKSFRARVGYCEQNLKRISSGSSRIVYEVDNDKVLKLAKNNKGIAQNNNEVELGTSNYFSCFADVYEYDDDGLWLEMQKARPARKGDFKSILGVPFEAVCYFVDSFHSRYARSSRYGSMISNMEYEETVENILNSEEGPAYDFFYGMEDYMGNYQLEAIGDLKRISSYGVVNNGGEQEIVLIDYGLSDDVFDDYYKKW